VELAESRARIAAAGADARSGLEGELHDTAQNRLVGLQIPLRLAQDRTEQPAPLRPTASPTSRGPPGRFHGGAGVLRVAAAALPASWPLKVVQRRAALTGTWSACSPMRSVVLRSSSASASNGVDRSLIPRVEWL
jgi:hypothetical protein